MQLINKLASYALGLVALLALAPDAAADFTVTGTFQYRDRAFTYTGGFTGSEPNLPIRLAKVQVLNASTSAVMATGATDANGDISIFVTGSGTANIKVRCFSESNAFGSKSLRVTNNSNVTYSVTSSTFSGHNLNTNLDIGSVTALKLTSGQFKGNAFNMLDQMVFGIQYIKASGGVNPPQSMRMKWPGGGGSFASGTVATISDDDGYDDIVQLHELGHVVHNVYSDSDSPGGSHTFGQSDQDPRLSFGEGWASFFAGAVRQHAGVFDPGFYMDLDGKGGTGAGTIQLRMRFENGSPYSSTTGGEADEGAVHCALWDIVDHANTNDKSPGTDDDGLDGSLSFGGLSADAAHWAVFTGPVKSASNLTIRNLWDGWFKPVDHTGQVQLEALFDHWKMRFFEDVSEPNGTAATATAVTPSSAYGAIKTLYFTTDPVGAPGAGDSDYYSFNLSAGATFDVETRYPNAKSDAETYADVRIEVRRPNGSLFASDNDSGAGRNAKLTGLVASTSGTWTVRVFTTHNYRKTGSYQLRVETTGGSGGSLTINNVAPATTPAVVVDGSTSVTLTGTNMLTVTGVKVDGLALSRFPPMFTIVNDSTLTFTMPKASKLGPVAIELTGTAGSAQSTIDVVANATPALELKNSDPGLLLQSAGLQFVIGGHPGDIAFVTASPELLPTPLPGIVDVDLAIGNNYTSLFILASPLIGAAGYTELTVPLSGLPPGFQIHVQSAHLLLSTLYALPAIASNVQSGTVLF
jgi:hypothetical protein